MNISSLFFSAADDYPNRTAIVDGHRHISYRELKKEVNGTAAYFQSRGIQKGDRILVFVPMSIDLYRVSLAIFQIGAVAVFLDEWVGKKRMELCCEIADCKGFIGVWKADILRLFSKPLRAIDIRLSLNKRIETTVEPARVAPSESALITFTTGSTGRPKAADRTHDFLHEQFKALLVEISPSPEDINMTTLPIVLFINLGVGATSVIPDFKSSKPTQMKPAKVIDQIKKTQTNSLISSPYFLKRLAGHTIKQNITDVKLERIFTGGAPVFPKEAAMIHDAFPQAHVGIVYGSTEAEPISSISASQLRNHDLVRGLPVGDVFEQARVAILPIGERSIGKTQEELEQIVLDDGEMGEIIVSGPHVLNRYYNSEEAFHQNKLLIKKTTDKTVSETLWHRTGDSGFIQENQLYLTGRCNQLIILNDQIIAPFMIEGRLQEIEGITAGTLLKINNQLVLAVESTSTVEAIKQTLDSLEFPYDVIKVFKKLPRDPRHHSKFDYDQLMSMCKDGIQ